MARASGSVQPSSAPEARRRTEPLEIRVHVVREWPEFFAELLAGRRFEVRRDDRAYAVGDHLRIREWNPRSKTYSGRELLARVGWIARAGERQLSGFELERDPQVPAELLPAGVVVLGLSSVEELR